MKRHILNNTKKVALWVGMALFGVGIAGAISASTASAQYLLDDSAVGSVVFSQDHTPEQQFSIGHRFPFTSNVTEFVGDRYSPSPFKPKHAQIIPRTFEEEEEEMHSAAYFTEPYRIETYQAGSMVQYPMMAEPAEEMHSAGYGSSMPMLPQTGAAGAAMFVAAGAVVAMRRKFM